MSRRRLGGWIAAALAMLSLGAAAPALGGGLAAEQLAPWHGVALPDSPYRWQTFVLGEHHPVTVVARVDRRGGEIGRHWTIRGSWHLGSPAYDGEGTGLAAHGRVLVLVRWDPAPRGLRRRTHLATLDLGWSRRQGRPGPFRRFSLSGDYTIYAISPDGSTLFLSHNRATGRGGPRFTIVPYDLRSHSLPSRNAAIRFDGEVLSGSAAARAQDFSGLRVYTLYVDDSGAVRRVYLLALDTVAEDLSAVELVRLRDYRDAFAIDLRLDPSGHRLVLRRQGRVLLRVDLRRFPTPHRAPRPPGATAGTVGVFGRVVGSSAERRPIELEQVGDLALPMRVLVFGCIHGDECGAERVEPLGLGGCPDPDSHVDVVANLDPDGSAGRSRLNAHGVDLNRNFPSGWRPIGSPGDPEYSGPRPFSEPETRLAARLIRRLDPRVTIWFHQHWGAGSFVRAWGASAPAARRFARLAGVRFRLLGWEAGTAPNWQNHAFPGTASFVVELPRGTVPQRQLVRIDRALARFAEEVGEDPRVARRG